MVARGQKGYNGVAILSKLPLEAFAETYLVQHERVKAVIARFGRHPHRNAVLGRLSTPEEEAYIATGDFPHLRGARAALA
jgi:uncharacterized protein (DUF924 family)